MQWQWGLPVVKVAMTEYPGAPHAARRERLKLKKERKNLTQHHRKCWSLQGYQIHIPGQGILIPPLLVSVGGKNYWKPSAFRLKYESMSACFKGPLTSAGVTSSLYSYPLKSTDESTSLRIQYKAAELLPQEQNHFFCKLDTTQTWSHPYKSVVLGLSVNSVWRDKMIIS